MRDGDRVVVDVDDPGGRVTPLRDLVHVLLGRDAGPEVEELADAGASRNRTARPRNARFSATMYLAFGSACSSWRPSSRSAAKLWWPPRKKSYSRATLGRSVFDPVGRRSAFLSSALLSARCVSAAASSLAALARRNSASFSSSSRTAGVSSATRSCPRSSSIRRAIRRELFSVVSLAESASDLARLLELALPDQRFGAEGQRERAVMQIGRGHQAEATGGPRRMRPPACRA